MKHLLVSFSLAASVSADQPNFILLLSDDQDWTGLSCQMHPDLPNSASDFYETPYLDRFAEESMRFSAAYAPSPVCSPTRISLQTGMNPATLGWTKAAPEVTGRRLMEGETRVAIHSDETTIAEELKSVGYATAHFGKWHLQGGGPEAHGYDVSDGNTGNPHAGQFTDPNPVDIFGMVEKATDFMASSQEKGTPFYLQMSWNALHYPENALASTRAYFEEKAPGSIHRDPRRAAITKDLDTGVGQLLEAVDELELRENTWVIYMSDNGQGGKGPARPLAGGKGGVWEGGIRVPLIVRGPGVEPGSWCHEAVVGYDLFPTFCALAGVTSVMPSELEGGDLRHLFVGENRPVKRSQEGLVFHFPHYQSDTPHSALILGEYKLMHFYETQESQLFELENDLAERNDLAAMKPEIVREMESRLFAYLEEVSAALPTENPDFDPNAAPVSDRDRKLEKKNRKKRG